MALFPSGARKATGDRSMSYGWFHANFKQWVDGLKLGVAVAHQARHTLATNLLRAGAWPTSAATWAKSATVWPSTTPKSPILTSKTCSTPSGSPGRRHGPRRTALRRVNSLDPRGRLGPYRGSVSTEYSRRRWVLHLPTRGRRRNLSLEPRLREPRQVRALWGRPALLAPRAGTEPSTEQLR